MIIHIPTLLYAEVNGLPKLKTLRRFWPIGRVIKVYTGEDNQVRVVDVKTSKNVYKRPSNKLVKLNLRE